jgi:hypothetical protein
MKNNREKNRKLTERIKQIHFNASEYRSNDENEYRRLKNMNALTKKRMEGIQKVEKQVETNIVIVDNNQKNEHNDTNCEWIE